MGIGHTHVTEPGVSCSHGRDLAENEEPCGRDAQHRLEDGEREINLCGKHYQKWVRIMRFTRLRN